jgi:hypothetical protein
VVAVGDGVVVVVGLGVGDAPVVVNVSGAVVLVVGVSLDWATRDPEPSVEPDGTVDA